MWRVVHRHRCAFCSFFLLPAWGACARVPIDATASPSPHMLPLSLLHTYVLHAVTCQKPSSSFCLSITLASILCMILSRERPCSSRPGRSAPVLPRGRGCETWSGMDRKERPQGDPGQYQSWILPASTRGTETETETETETHSLGPSATHTHTPHMHPHIHTTPNAPVHLRPAVVRHTPVVVPALLPFRGGAQNDRVRRAGVGKPLQERQASKCKQASMRT